MLSLVEVLMTCGLMLWTNMKESVSIYWCSFFVFTDYAKVVSNVIFECWLLPNILCAKKFAWKPEIQLLDGKTYIMLVTFNSRWRSVHSVLGSHNPLLYHIFRQRFPRHRLPLLLTATQTHRYCRGYSGPWQKEPPPQPYSQQVEKKVWRH